MADSIHNLQLVDLLDELRDAYALCTEQPNPQLQSLLMRIRRKMLDALHESLNLYGENAELHQQLSEAQAEIKRLQTRGSPSGESEHTGVKLQRP